MCFSWVGDKINLRRLATRRVLRLDSQHVVQLNKFEVNSWAYIKGDHVSRSTQVGKQNRHYLVTTWTSWQPKLMSSFFFTIYHLPALDLPHPARPSLMLQVPLRCRNPSILDGFDGSKATKTPGVHRCSMMFHDFPINLVRRTWQWTAETCWTPGKSGKP
jgi:hypothetical protein